MAYDPTTQWECRASGGDNGGGFTAALGGTDFSQADAPTLILTDGACTGNTTFTSATGGFLATHLGNVIRIPGTGHYQITAVTNSNTVTVDKNGPNASGLTFRVGGAYLININGLGFVPAAGNKVWIRLGTYPLSANPLSPTAGSVTAPLVIEGYNAVRGDIQAVPSLARPVLKWSSSSINLVAPNGVGQVWRHLEIDATGSATTPVSFTTASSNCVMENCKITGQSAGIAIDVLGKRNTIRRCYVLAGTGAADALFLEGLENTLVEMCHLKGVAGNTGNGIQNWGAGNTIRNNIIETFSVGLLFANTTLAMAWLESNSFYANGTNLKVTAAAQGIAGVIPRWNIFAKATTYEVDYTPANLAASAAVQEWMNDTWDCNWYYTTATRYHNLPTPTGDQTLLADPFNNGAGGDFGLNNVAGGGADVRARPCAEKLGDGVNSAAIVAGHSGCPATAQTAPSGGTAPVIDEVQLDPNYSRGATGGSRHPTLFVETPSGSEQRIKLWVNRRRSWQLSFDSRDLAGLSSLINFWEARDGGARGFRFKDWNEFSVTNEPLVPTGVPTVQLIRTYTSGSITRTQNIYKPVASPAVTLRKNGAAFVGYSLDTTTGLVTLSALNSKAITAISLASSAVVTVGASHGFALNDEVYFSGVVGMTPINGRVGVVTATGATTITVNIDSSGFSSYTSGGTAAKYLAVGDTLDWSGQWDVPVRFDLQSMDMTSEDAFIRSWSSIRVKELVS